MTTYPNTAAGYAQAIADHGESNLLVDPFAHTITVKPAEAAPADRYVTAEQFRDRFSDQRWSTWPHRMTRSYARRYSKSPRAMTEWCRSTMRREAYSITWYLSVC